MVSELLALIPGGFFDEHDLIDDLMLDVTLTESHIRNADVSAKPVEQGAAITDAIIIQPSRLQIEFLVRSDFSTSVHKKLDRLDGIVRQRELFDVVTSLSVYPNMFFSGEMRIERTPENPETAKVNAALVEMRIVETSSTEVPTISSGKTPSDKRAQSPGVDRGAVTKTPSLPDAEKSRSWGASIFGL